MNILIAFFQCGIFILIPLTTLWFGVQRILQLDEKYHRISAAGLIGFISFEASTIGMLIDPRSSNIGFKEMIITSIIVGIAIFLFVILFLPIAMTIVRIFKK